MLKAVNDLELEERVLKSEKPTAIAFLSYYSIPCDHYKPELDNVAESLKYKMEFYQIDTDENPTITDKLGVESIPTLLIFRDSSEIARYEGAYSREALLERITSVLNKH